MSLTVQQIDELKAAFASFDKDGSGTIDGNDLGHLMKTLGENFKGIELQACTNQRVDFSTLQQMISKKNDDSKRESHLRKAFQMFDKDQNGFICRDELRQAMLAEGETINEAELDKMMAEADVNGDGLVNYDEFIGFLFK
ncbi:unnamed protein product, partial [Mesorhabditis belari]|uniref:EF-hand domain-containing protein n=1 Tax=Mesorhabditis belari TaxID=2138241 RepID=A0AAF3EH08_9BILA